MKRLAVLVLTAVLAVLAVPILLASGDTELAAPGCGVAGATNAILATIREVESGGEYRARSRGSTASGAYQFTDGTWARFHGYVQAWAAPAAVQDAKATERVTAIMAGAHGDVSVVPVVWYLGHLPPPGSAEWDRVPAAGAGNRLTPRQYQAKWMSIYMKRARNGSPTANPPTDPSASPPSSGPDASAPQCTMGPPLSPLSGGWSIPGPPDLFARAPVNRPHHDHPAWDWPVPQGTPIYAIHGGRATSIHTSPGNWFEHGCASRRTACDPCGTGVTIQDAEGTQWTYCHGTALHVAVGQIAAAGSRILTSGNTGRSTGPHVHIGIRTGDGLARCPQPLMRALQHDRSTSAQLLPTSGCTT